ncbi:MAG: carbohydrate ABC transporter permease [Gaiellales bacterium]
MKRAGILSWPYLFGLTVLVGVPALAAFALAFTSYSGFQSPSFVGLDNFSRMVGDDLFWTSVGNSLIYIALSVPVRLIAAVGLALLLFRRGPGIALSRTAVFLPSVVPDAAYGLLWLWILNPLYGPLAAAFGQLGVSSTGFLTDPWATRVAIAAMGAFQIGEAFVIALAARRTIPAYLYEAAAIEGASAWRTTTRVTLPLMAPILALLALRDVVASLQSNFIAALVVTDGGPRYATTFLPYYLYKQGFGYFRFGYASAMAVSLFVITALAVFVQYRLARRWRLI